ncbi:MULTISPECIES: trans-sulfuration enzyme family protein [unclassified Arthrobacter]|uniref:trans-sulfuration enzyme family protein n=1 Tax=unclassified Arthrobacter TaxID=235627 RepID=UPI002E010C57|nr:MULTISPECIES: PLP-dependent aspartate aminotransferase family protein [unclassified Arthrobacter]MEC5192582.1 methionine-gamma-lyase [Arthrobacter sp. MP_M4]MEC5204066.1 methionine-gamma-lyase [Arthrobacter sp. MP_M7]
MLSQDSLAVHAGRTGLTDLGVHAVPIDLSTTAPLPSVQDGGLAYEHLATGGSREEGQSTVYQRLWNPTVARFEEGVAVLEDTPEAVAFATGMAALSAVLLAVVSTGKKHVVAVRPLYGGSDHLLAAGLLGNEVTFTTPAGVHAALRPDTGLVILETPANPSLELVDIAGVVAAADGVPLLVDNTFASPILQQPFRHGAAMVLHSATKFLGGHGDAMGGVVAAAPEWTTRLRQIRAVTGGILTPWPAYLLHRGLATLPVRARAQQASAQKVAFALAGHGLVRRVFYPGLPECDPHGLVGTQMAGPGSLIAFELGSAEHAERAPGAVGMITHAVSLGGIDTLIQHPAGLTHRPVAAGAKPHAGLLRVSVGLEDPADIVADLVQAIEATR